MRVVEEAIKAVNAVLELVGEEPIHISAEGNTKQRLESLLDVYTERLVAKCPQYKKIKNKKDIPEMMVIYLKDLIDKQS